MRYEECQSPAFYPSFLRTCGIKLSGWKGVGVKLSLSKGLLAKRNKLKGQKGHNIFQKKVQGFDMECWSDATKRRGLSLRKTNWGHVCLWFTISVINSSLRFETRQTRWCKTFYVLFTRNDAVIYSRPREWGKSVGMSHSYSSSLPQVFQKFLVWQCNAVIHRSVSWKKKSQ